MSYLKGANYNLCSIDKMLQEGWTMTVDNDGTIMNRNGEEIQYDIITKTSKGALYCGYFQHTGEETAAAEL